MKKSTYVKIGLGLATVAGVIYAARKGHLNAAANGITDFVNEVAAEMTVQAEMIKAEAVIASALRK